MFENTIKEINKQTKTPLDDGKIDICIKKILKLRDNTILSYIRFRDFFTLLRNNDYFEKYPIFFKYCERFSEGVSLICGDLALIPMESYNKRLDNNDGVSTIMLRICEDKAVLEVLDRCGTCFMSVPFVEDGKIISVLDGSTLERMKTIEDKRLWSFTEDFNFWVENEIEKFNKSLIRLNETFDLRAANILEKFQEKRKGGEEGFFLGGRLEIKGGENK